MRIRRAVRCQTCGASYIEEAGRGCPVCERGGGVVRSLQGGEGRAAAPSVPSPSPASPKPLAPRAPGGYVCGWLVLREGPQRGRPYRLTAGKNAVGGAGCAVALESAPDVRGHSASILYDPVGNAFFALNADGPDLAYVNDELLLEPRRLRARDILRLAGASLRFVPFCGDRFRWDDDAP